MKNWFKENWFKIGLLAILVISIAGVFYWFELRPTQIREHCSSEACLIKEKGGFICLVETLSILQKEQLYKNCLRENGLEK